MKHYPNTIQNDQEEIIRFVEEMKMATLLTTNSSNSLSEVESGVFNPVYIDGKYYLHLNKTDSQFKAMEQNPKAKLIYFDFLSNIPSYWFDEKHGGLATSYYRHLDLTCDVKIYKEKSELAEILKMFLTKYQPEGGYDPLTLENSIYQADYKVLGIAVLTPTTFASKWKLGQNKEIEKRLEVISKLKQRNDGNDLRAAMEVERWITRYQK